MISPKILNKKQTSLISKEDFEKIWNKVDKEANEEGNLSIDDWSEMSRVLSKYCEDNNLEKIKEGGIIRGVGPSAFLAGAKWAFKYIFTEKNK